MNASSTISATSSPTPTPSAQFSSGGGAATSDAPRNAKYDPLWARRAAAALMESQGLKVVEVQQTVTELRKEAGGGGPQPGRGARGSGGAGERGSGGARACKRASILVSRTCAFASSRLTQRLIIIAPEHCCTLDSHLAPNSFILVEDVIIVVREPDELDLVHQRETRTQHHA